MADTELYGVDIQPFFLLTAICYTAVQITDSQVNHCKKPGY